MREEKLLDILEDIMRDRQLDISIKDNQDLKMKLIRKIHENELITNEIDDVFQDEDEYFIFYSVNNANETNNSSIIEDILNKISKCKINGTNKYESINLYFIFHEIKGKLSFDKYQKEDNFRKKILKAIKLKGLNLKLRDIELKTLFIGVSNNHTFNIKIKDRIRSLENYRKIELHEGDFGVNIKGLVFNANLKDIVSIYNILGNELFDKNLRYSIKDELDVDIHIKDTLKTNPDEFWYLNNGITMIIEDDDFKLRKSDSIQIKYGNCKILSIINGAQTISASAEYFYENEDINEHKDNNPSVILRVIQISKFGSDSENEDMLNKRCSEEINKISVALNRQKPIKQEDIAYTTSFVYEINQLNEKNNNSNNCFKIEKRSTEKSDGYDLLEFAKIVKSYLAQSPGLALTQGAKKLLKLKDNELENTDIFKYEFDEDDEYDVIFNKYYKPVNFAAKLMNLYTKHAKCMIMESNNKESESVNVIKLNIASYGKLYFIAYIIYILNEKSVTDFSNFNLSCESLNDEKFLQYIDEYIELLYKVIDDKNKADKKEITINSFKNDDIYNYFKDYHSENDNELSKEIKNYHEKLFGYFNLKTNKESLAEN